MWAYVFKACAISVMVIFLISEASVDTEFEFLKEPTSIYVKPNDNRAAFFCDVLPSSADIQWLWRGQLITQSKWIKVSRNKLTIHLGKVEKSSKSYVNFEAGFFQCEARLKNKVLVSGPAKLIVAVFETFPMQSDVNVTAIRGSTAVIPCSPPYSVPKVVTEFIFNGSTIEKSNKHQKLMSSGDLQIFDVNTLDSGEYICVANNPFLSEKRQANHKVFLSVIDPVGPKAPSFVIFPHPKTSAVLGSNISLECVVTGYPIPIVTWRRHHGSLPRWRYQQIAGNLLLISVRRGDEGIYYCEADNSVGSQITKSTEIQVQEMPKIVKLLKDLTVKVGQNITLDCIARGHPEPIVTWFHNGRTLALDHANKVKESQFIIRNVSYKHSGIFQCFASNEIGTVSATSIVTISSGNKSLDDDYGNEDYEGYLPHSGHIPLTYSDENEMHLIVKGHKLDHNEDGSEKVVGLIPGDSSPKRRKKKKSKGVKLIPPSRPEITRLSDTSVMVRWSVPQNDGLPILFFKVQYREVKRRNTHWMTIDEDIAAHILSYAVSDLKTGGKYRFRIAAVYSNNDNKLGPNSEKFILHKIPPTRKPIIGPKIVFAEAASPSDIVLQWKYTDMDSISIDGFFISYRTTHSAGDYIKVAVPGTYTRSYIISHLLPDTSYDVKMQCFNSAGTSEFSNIYTCKTKTSETAVEMRSHSSKPHHSEVLSGILRTQPVSSKNSDGNMVLYIVLGIICIIMVVAMSVFIVLFIRQRQNRHQNRNNQNGRGTSTKATNGHISMNGFISSREKVNISINPLSQIDEDDSNKSDQFDNEISNNNEIIRMQASNRTEAPQEGSLLVDSGIKSEVLRSV